MDEAPLPAELPRPYVARIARAKAAAVAEAHPGAVVLAGDTSIAVGRRILGKPADDANLAAMLRLLSGRRHHCLSAVCVIDAAGQRRERLSDTVIAFRPLTEATIAAYVATGEGQGKARRLCHPGPRRGMGAPHGGQPFGRRRSAARRDAGAPDRRRYRARLR